MTTEEYEKTSKIFRNITNEKNAIRLLKNGRLCVQSCTDGVSRDVYVPDEIKDEIIRYHETELKKYEQQFANL